MNKIKIFFLSFHNQHHNKDKFWQILSKQEKNRAKKFFTTQLQNKYIITHGVLRIILSKYLNILPENIIFTKSKYGKPYVKNIFFNLSHTKHYVIFSITKNEETGVDIEYINPNINLNNIIQNFFSNEESTIFHSLTHTEQVNFFFKTWTMKEAILKATGWGLRYPLMSINTVQIERTKSLIIKSIHTQRKENWFLIPTKQIIQKHANTLFCKNKIHNIEYIEFYE